MQGPQVVGTDIIDRLTGPVQPGIEADVATGGIFKEVLELPVISYES